MSGTEDIIITRHFQSLLENFAEQARQMIEQQCDPSSVGTFNNCFWDLDI